MEINFNGTLNLAKQASELGVKRFIFLSTIKVLGESTTPGNSFNYSDKANALDAYSISKKKAEEGLMNIAKETDLEVVIIRPPLVYGPGVKANFLKLMNLVRYNLPLPLRSIDNKRSFVSLNNLLDLILTCVEHPEAKNRIFLVSDDYDVSTSELLLTMAKVLNRKALIFPFSPYLLKKIGKIVNKEEMISRLCDNLQVDIQYTKEVLGWSPKISFEEGIKLCTSSLKETN
tara:strand:- start:262 stop:954 length:693 start_codon:yes stop_codon:yes gene_type:complete